MGFEQCRGELRHLGLHLRASVVQRRPADRLRAAAEGADPLLDHRRIAVVNRHMVQGHTELVGQHLREGGLVALSVRRRAGRSADPAVPLDGDLRVRKVCEGRRYQDDMLKLTWYGRSILDVLEVTVTDAPWLLRVGQDPPQRGAGIARGLQLLVDVGVGYLRLGQSLSTLSGGEAQRLKGSWGCGGGTISRRGSAGGCGCTRRAASGTMCGPSPGRGHRRSVSGRRRDRGREGVVTPRASTGRAA